MDQRILVAKNKDVDTPFPAGVSQRAQMAPRHRSEALELLPRITTLPKQYVQAAWETYTKAVLAPGRQGQSQRTPVGDRFDGRGWIAQKIG